MAQLADVLLQGLRSAQPAATAVAAGTLYYVTDEFLTEQSDGAAWSAYSGPGFSLPLSVADGGTGVSDGAAIRMVTVILTDAQIKALPTTPIELVAAPGANMKVKPIGLTLRSNTTAGAYTNIDASYADLHLDINGHYASYGPVDDSTSTPVLTGVSNILGAAGSVVYDGVVPSLSATSVAGTSLYVQPDAFPGPATVLNQPLDLKMENNGSGNLTGGNAANTLKVVLYYVIEDLS